MKIGILQTGLVPETLTPEYGEYPDMFTRFLAGRGFAFDTYRVVEGVFPDGPEAADGWLITGSRHGVYEDHPWIAPLEALIRQIVEADKSLVGICFGHQIIAQALGGTVQKYAGGWRIGAQTYQFADGPKRLLAYHQDQVTALPEGAQLVAGNEGCKYAALLYPGKAYTVQPHPEFTAPFVQGLIDKRGRGVIDDDLLDAAEAGLHHSLDNTALADQLALFLTKRRIA